MNAKVASRFSDERDYFELKKWMNKLITVHGGVPLAEDDEKDEEISFHSDVGDDDMDDDDLESEEDVEADFVGYDDKVLKKMQEENK